MIKIWSEYATIYMYINTIHFFLFVLLAGGEKAKMNGQINKNGQLVYIYEFWLEKGRKPYLNECHQSQQEIAHAHIYNAGPCYSREGEQKKRICQQ